MESGMRSNRWSLRAVCAWLSPLATAGVLFAASASSAYTLGHPNGAGLEGKCADCHGASQYSGLQFLFDGSKIEDANCWGRNGDTPVKIPLLIANYGTDIAAQVKLDAPGADEAPVCPSTDCCDPDNQPDFCTAADTRGCQIGSDTCGDKAAAGFGARTVGGATFTAGDGTRLHSIAGEAVPEQIVHSVPRYFDGDAPITWEFSLRTPDADSGSKEMSVYVGANVANNNGFADNLDLNSNYVARVLLGTRDTVTLPDYCQTCPEGATLNTATGECEGGGCASASATSPVLAGLALLVFGWRRRRRRR